MEIDNGIERQNKNLLNRMIIRIGVIFIILIILITLVVFKSISHSDISYTNVLRPHLDNIGMTLSIVVATISSSLGSVVICFFKLNKNNH